MRIVVAGYGSTGDTLPLIALAEEAKRSGHEVVLVTEASAAERAAQAGIDVRILPGDARAIVTEGSHGFGQTMRSGRPSMQMFVQLARLNTAEWIATIDAAAEDADVIVATTLVVYHAASVAQERGLPLVFGQMQPTLATRDYAPPMLGVTAVPPWLNRPLAGAMQRVGDISYRGAIRGARRALGQPALRLVWEELPILAAWSPTLVPVSPDWNHPNATITGPWLRRPEPDWAPPASLTAFLDAGEPPVYVGFGSMAGFRDMDRVRSALLEGLSDRRVLLSSGWAGHGASSLPGNVHPIDWTPVEWLFPRCSAIVHHCGAGTTHRAARSGVPSICVPFMMDQPFWAGRLHRLGIAPPALNPRKLDAQAVRDAVAVATASGMRRTAQEVAGRLAAEPDGARAALGTIERLIC